MTPSYYLLVFCLFCTVASSAQPVWSPKVRAARESRWMHDSLHLTSTQLEKVNPILLNYQQQMDQNYASDQKQQELTAEKDKSLKTILDKNQYKIYYRREEQIRSIPKRSRTGSHQPY